MGHKVHPKGLRLGFIKDWDSRWYAAKRKTFAAFILEDEKIRKYIKKNFSSANISRVDIERAGNRVRVIVYSGRPGVIIGRRGADIDRLRDELQTIAGKELFVDIKEVQSPTTDAQLVAESVAFQLEKRIAFRRAMKKAVSQAMTDGALGIKVICAGRLGGAEIARTEKYQTGKVPLHTLRADIDFGFSEAFTTYGTIGVKCWIYKGDVLTRPQDTAPAGAAETKDSKTSLAAASNEGDKN
ncbi:MAG: 30S ribosomal protein S3 [Candidatus Omnitrophica bacterium]|nr:30S ribosomal protein S3 [Candidatus Omnitrophota bacterium]